MYPDNAAASAWNKKGQGNKTKNIATTEGNDNSNFLTRVNTNNCGRFGAIQTQLSTTKAAQIDEYLFATYGEDLEEVTGATVADRTTFKEMCDYILAANLTGVPLNFTYTNKTVQLCRASVDSSLYTESFGNPGLWKLRSAEFLLSLRDYSAYINKNLTAAQMNNAQKWLKRTSGAFPKFVGYFVGNEVLSSWITAIGYDLDRGVKQGGALFIEFFRNETNGTAYVRLFLQEPEDIT